MRYFDVRDSNSEHALITEAGRLLPPDADESIILDHYLARLDKAVVKVSRWLAGRVSTKAAALVDDGLTLYESIPYRHRWKTLGHPHFCYWWTTLRERCRERDLGRIEDWLKHFHRMMVPAALRSGIAEGPHLVLALDETVLRFPTLAGQLRFAKRRPVDGVVDATIASPGVLRIRGGRELTLEELTGEVSHQQVEVRRTVAQGKVEVDASDPWLKHLLRSLNAQRAPEGYPRRDLRPVELISDELAGNLDSALALMRAVYNPYYGEFTSHTRMIVPYHSVCYSTFTDTCFSGAVFLSEAHRPFSSIVDTAEHLLHEHSHYRFALMLEIDEFAADDGQLYASPWRRDERDLNGMLQAIFVFGRVAHFLRLAAEHGDRVQCLKRRSEVVGDLETALRHLSEAGPLEKTSVGARLFADIVDELGRCPS